jgi:hypothetical protein
MSSGFGRAYDQAKDMSGERSLCDPYGENLINTVLPGSGWTYHHDEVNLHVHNIVKHSGMASDIEVESYFILRLRESAITSSTSTPLLSKQLKEYVPDGRQTRISSARHPAIVDQFT